MNAQRSDFLNGAAAFLSAWCAVLLLAGCVGKTNSTTPPPSPPPTQTLPPAISVAVAPSTASVQLGQTKSFTATVSNDSQNKGVAWALAGMGCGVSCGTLSAASSASGSAVTYTAPPSVPTSPAVTLTATSIADGTKTATAKITLTAPPAISVTVAPPTASVQAGGTMSFTAILQNDSQNKGVIWSLTGAGCSGPTCGTVSLGSSFSGEAIVYTAPSAAPATNITLTATSIADETKSAAATITVTPLPITVSVLPTTSSLAVGGTTQPFTATLQNDSQSAGVTWTLSGAGCAAVACGTVSPASSVSGAAVTYASPAKLPNPATVTLNATSVASGTVATATITLTPPPAPAPAAPVVVGTPLVDQGYGDPEVATEANNNVDVAWVDINGAAFSRSTDGGATFSTPDPIPSDLSNTTGPENQIQIAVDASGNINLLWRLDPTGASTSLENVFSRSTDGGATFSAAVTLSTTPTPALLAVQPGGIIVVTWFDQTTSNLLASTSTDGTTFSSPATVWSATGNPMDLTLAMGPQGQLDLFWTQLITTTNCSILFSESADGVTFSPAASISANAGACNQSPAAFADSTGAINVSWDADGTSLFFSRSTDSGTTFSTPTSVPTSPQPNSQQVSVGSDGTIYLLWDTPTGVLFSASSDGGATFFATPTSLGVTGGAGEPVMGVDACSYVSVVGEGTGPTMLLQRSTDGGLTFTEPLAISTLPNDFYPELAVDANGNVNVTYEIDGPHDVDYVRVPSVCSLH